MAAKYMRLAMPTANRMLAMVVRASVSQPVHRVGVGFCPAGVLRMRDGGWRIIWSVNEIAYRSEIRPVATEASKTTTLATNEYQPRRSQNSAS